jgi:hypothetical protein
MDGLPAFLGLVRLSCLPFLIFFFVMMDLLLKEVMQNGAQINPKQAIE